MNDFNELSGDLRDAVVAAGRVVIDNFGKEIGELDPVYKKKDGDTVRTVIDTHAQAIMQEILSQKYPDAVFNLEENEISGNQDLSGKLLIFGDPFDGTANAQPRLPLSTQGLIAAIDGEFVAAAVSHPFERYVLFGAKNSGVFRQKMHFDPRSRNSEFALDYMIDELPRFDQLYADLLSGKKILMAYVDAHYTPINFVAQRKTQWKSRLVETLDKEYGGQFNARMMREMGSNIDAGMKLAEGRLHVQLTDTIGGVYDVAAGAVFMPMLGGVITDQYGNPFRVPKNRDEMNTPPQQVVIASIHPAIHEKVQRITEEMYGQEAVLYSPSTRTTFTAGPYKGFKSWDPECKRVHDAMLEMREMRE